MLTKCNIGARATLKNPFRAFGFWLLALCLFDNILFQLSSPTL